MQVPRGPAIITCFCFNVFNDFRNVSAGNSGFRPSSALLGLLPPRKLFVKTLARIIDSKRDRRYSQRRYRIWSLTPTRKFLRHFRAKAWVRLAAAGFPSRPPFDFSLAGVRRVAPVRLQAHQINKALSLRSAEPMKRRAELDALGTQTLTVLEDIENIEDRSGDHAKP